MKNIFYSMLLNLLLIYSAFALFNPDTFINKPLDIFLTQYPDMTEIVIKKLKETAKQNHYTALTSQSLLQQPITYLSPQLKTAETDSEICIVTTLFIPELKQFVDYSLCISMCIINLDTYLNKFSELKEEFVKKLQNSMQKRNLKIPSENDIEKYQLTYIGLAKPPTMMMDIGHCVTITLAKKFSDNPIYVCVKQPSNEVQNKHLKACKKE